MQVDVKIVSEGVLKLEICEICLKVKNLFVKYGEVTVLENVNFSVRKGTFTTIVGPNGGGKTTLIKAILGLIKPVKGEIYIFGLPPNEYLKKRTVGYVPQGVQERHNVPMTVEDVVFMGIRKGYLEPKGKFKDQVNRALEVVGMLDKKKKLIKELSGGERQRVMIARAIVSQPELLIMDEPTVGLDVESQRNFYDLVRKLKEDLMITVLMVTHDVGFVSEYSDSILCINRRLVRHAENVEELPREFFEKLYGFAVRPVLHKHKEGSA